MASIECNGEREIIAIAEEKTAVAVNNVTPKDGLKKTS